MFNDPNLLEKIAANSNTKHLLADPSFMQSLRMVQSNPKLLQQEIVQDQGLKSVMAMLLGMNLGHGGAEPMQTEAPVYLSYCALIGRCVHRFRRPRRQRRDSTKSRLLLQCLPKKPQQTRKRIRAMRRTKLALLTRPSLTIKRHGSCTRTSHISTISPRRTLKKGIANKALQRLKEP